MGYFVLNAAEPAAAREAGAAVMTQARRPRCSA
eukprot:COSAG01_NODE_33334_length_566_cov_0.631692_2_plen_32_part_01